MTTVLDEIRALPTERRPPGFHHLDGAHVLDVTQAISAWQTYCMTGRPGLTGKGKAEKFNQRDEVVRSMWAIHDHAVAREGDGRLTEEEWKSYKRLRAERTALREAIGGSIWEDHRLQWDAEMRGIKLPWQVAWLEWREREFRCVAVFHQTPDPCLYTLYALADWKLGFGASPCGVFAVNIRTTETGNLEDVYEVSAPTWWRTDGRRDLFPDGSYGFVNWHLDLALFALMLANCRNVQFVDRPPNRAARRRAAKTGARPPIAFHELVIGPLVRRLRAATIGLSGEAKRKTALHVCRGHFKEYSEDRPLFGRLAGRYWWEQQVRGDADRGLVFSTHRMAT